MSPALRNGLLIAGAVAFAVFAGFEIALDNLGVVAPVGVLLLLVALHRLTDIRTEAILTGAVIVGYIVGNRGFAQQMISHVPPLLPAEAALLGASVLLLIRGAHARRFPIAGDTLSTVLLFWLVLVSFRLPFDVRQHGLVALRDYAMIYYGAFFFIGYEIARHDRDRRFLEHAFTVAFALLPPAFLVSQLAPELLWNYLSLGSVPLIIIKPDLASAFCATALFWCYPRLINARTMPERFLFGLIFAANLGIVGYAIGRSTLVGLAAACAYLWWARERKILFWLGGFAAVGILAVTTIALLRGEDFRQTKVYSLYEHAVSIFDVSGNWRYESQDAHDSPDNNRFRLVWWKSLVTETVEESPVFGLGYGHDLARGFVHEYDPLMAEEFSARSPHNIVMTIFARTGATGLVGFLVIVFVAARRAFAVAGQPREAATAQPVYLWTMMGTLFVCACFGVVLEGPMGAVPFWVLVGLAAFASEAHSEPQS